MSEFLYIEIGHLHDGVTICYYDQNPKFSNPSEV